MSENARRFVLALRPVGEPKETDLRLEDFAVPAPGPGEVLLRTLYLSLDPYMRGRMSDAKSYAAPVAIGGVMEGGTVFHFVTDGIESALDKAKHAAGDLDVKIGGGVSTVRQYLEIGAIDELHLAMSPVILGRGEALFAGLDLSALGYAVTESAAGEKCTHLVLTRQ